MNNIFSIAPGVPFLKELASAVLEDRFGTVVEDADDPFRLANITIYLPTRRALRALRSEFSTQLGANASLLPRMRTFGDEDEGEFAGAAQQAHLANVTHGEDAPGLLQPVSPTFRQIILSRLVRRWVELISADTKALYGDEDIAIPSSTPEALYLAGELGSLIDQMRTEEIDWKNLNALSPEDFSNWWGLTLEFLKIPAALWPQHLEEIGMEDPAGYRNRLLDLRSSQLVKRKSEGLVIAAGSTGSIPATSRFIKTVAGLENGVVVLPGIDFHLTPDTWDSLGQERSTHEDHSQFGLAQLLSDMGRKREDIIALGEENQLTRLRGQMISDALLPSDQVDQWVQKRQSVEGPKEDASLDAMSAIGLIEAPAERQEALAIALVLRKQLETEDRRAALVTPDRNLARRVGQELKRFGLEVDDSSGQPLRNTSANQLAMELIAVASGDANAANLACLVKHPLGAFCRKDFGDGKTARLFERLFLRGAQSVPRAGEFVAVFERALKRVNDIQAKGEQIFSSQRLLLEYVEELRAFCQFADEVLSPLARTLQSEERFSVHLIYRQLLETLRNVSALDEDGNPNVLEGDAGDALEEFLLEVSREIEPGFDCLGAEFARIHDELILGRTVRSSDASHPRLFILGALEARLQNFDCVVLGAMNEGKWPAQFDSGPFLNRQMKRAIGLPTPERRIGLAAHDFEQFMGASQVYISRALREDNAPSVSSRLVQRLLAFVGEEASKTIRARGQEFVNMAERLDVPASLLPRVERPNPKPPIEARPRQISVTDVELWIRDPYALYAKRVLNLRPIDQLDQNTDAALRGTLLHNALAVFVGEGLQTFDSDQHGALMNCIEAEAVSLNVPEHLMATWRERFNEITHDLLSQEKLRADNIAKSICEIDGRLVLGAQGFEISGRADRLDLRHDGDLEIIDYKTGTNPSATMGRSLSPQLPVEALIAASGGFGGLGPLQTHALYYVRLRARGEFKFDSLEVGKSKRDHQPISEIISVTQRRLEKLITEYDGRDQGYLSRYAPMSATSTDGYYDHLARTAEWSWGEDESGEDA